MNTNKRISSAVIKRLPRYYRYLGDLLEADIARTSSEELSARMNLTASQIRQDFNNFGCFGQQGYGYNVSALYSEIKTILGLDRKYRLIIIGAGNIGQSLANYANFEKRGFTFTAIFDQDPNLIGQDVNGLTVLDINTLDKYLQEQDVDIAVLTLPKVAALKISEKIIKAGVKGIWNFSHVDISVPPNVVVENVHLTDSLLTLSYRLNEQVTLENCRQN